MTFADKRLREGAKELHELTRTHNAPDGMFVRGRCYMLRRGSNVRYEILIDGFGQYALVDVMRRQDLESRLAQAMECFASSSRLRNRVPLPTR